MHTPEIRTQPMLRRAAVLALAVVAIDQVTKAVALPVAQGHTSGPLVPVTNPEFSLGIAGAPLPAMAILAATGIIAAGAYTLHLAVQGRMPVWVPALLVGGAISNLTDRLLFGAVNDFLATPWIVFNLADIAVVAGVAGFVFTTLIHAPRKEVTP